MNICETTVAEKNPPLISGHLYTHDEVGMIYIYCAVNKSLINLVHGTKWSNERVFGPLTGWKDVTDEYCLQKVK